MYNITINGEFFFGTGKYARPLYEIVSPNLSLEKNTAGSFEFAIYPRHPCYASIEELTSYVEISANDRIIFRGRVLSIQKGFYNEKIVMCEGCLAYLMDTIQRPYDFLSNDKHTTPDELFKLFLQRHNITVDAKRQLIVGRVTVTDANNYIVRSDSTYMNTLDSIREKLLTSLGGVLNIRYEDDANYIDYLANIENVSTQTIEFGKNLLDINITENADEIATVIIPLGAEVGDARMTISLMPNTTTDDICKSGDKVYSKKGVEKYGHIEKSIVFDDIFFPSYLVSRATSYLKTALNINESIELSAADLSAVNADIENFKIGELVRVVSAPHEIQRQFEVSKLDIDLMNPKSNKLTLGTASDSLTTQVSSGVSGAVSYYGGGSSYQAGSGLEIFGTTINHKNNIAAGSLGDFDDKLLSWGEKFPIPNIEYDSEGHIKTAKTRLLQLPLASEMADKTHEYTQSTASKIWVILHNLNKKPSINVIDDYGAVILCDIEYTNLNTVVLRFSEPTAGTAHLN